MCNTDCLLILDGRCYEANFTVARTHADAADYCAQRGSYLASVLSPLIPQIYEESNDSYWIGLQDIDRNGTFQWADGSVVDYLNFNSTETTRTECIVGGSQGSQYWNYAECNSTHYSLCSAGGRFLLGFLHLYYIFKYSFSAITSPPEQFASSAITYSSVLLSWEEIPLSNRHAPILGYKLRYNGISSDSTEREVQLAPNALNASLTDLQFNVRYNFTLRANGKLGTGPNSTLQLVTPFKGLFLFYIISWFSNRIFHKLYLPHFRINHASPKFNSIIHNIEFILHPMVESTSGTSARDYSQLHYPSIWWQ